jgi:xylitol oxidase
MPTSLEEVQEIVAAADRIHALGSRHSFNDMGEAAELVSLDRMPANVVVEGDGVSFNAGLTYGALVR